MPDFREDQLFTVFGGTCVSEHHGLQFPREQKYSSSTKVMVLLGALMVGFSTAATAVAVRHQEHAVPMGPSLPNIPGIATLANAAY